MTASLLLTPAQRGDVELLLGFVMVLGAASVGATAFFLRRRAQTSSRLARLGLVMSGVVLASTMVLGPLGIAVVVFSSLETEGYLLFRPDGGRANGDDLKVRIDLPAGWRMRYGRQSWREGTVLDTAGAAQIRVSVGFIDPYGEIRGEDPLRGYAATRGEAEKKRSPRAQGEFRQGTRGLEWVFQIPAPLRDELVQCVEVAQSWRGRVLVFRFTREDERADLKTLAEAWTRDARFLERDETPAR